MKPRSLSASTITGTNVENLQGDSIGKIHDLMIDLETGEVLYAVLSHGGFLGIGNDFFAVPIQALVVSDRDEDLFKLDVDKEILETAPGFDKDHWPEEPATEFTNTVYKHYGYERHRMPHM